MNNVNVSYYKGKTFCGYTYQIYEQLPKLNNNTFKGTIKKHFINSNENNGYFEKLSDKIYFT